MATVMTALGRQHPVDTGARLTAVEKRQPSCASEQVNRGFAEFSAKLATTSDGHWSKIAT